MVTRKTLIGLAAVLVLIAAACSGGDRPTFDEAVEDGESTTTTAASGDDSTDESTTETTEPTPEPEALVRFDPPPPPDPNFPPQPTAEDAIAVYAGVALERSQFVGDCANKPDGDTSPTLCYVTDNVTWTVGPNETEPWYVMVVIQVEGGWVVSEVTSAGAAAPPEGEAPPPEGEAPPPEGEAPPPEEGA